VALYKGPQLDLALREHYVYSRTKSFVAVGLNPDWMKNETLPTDAELSLLRYLWKSGPSTVREVRDGAGPSVGYTTVLKLLQIMLAKGLVERDESGVAHTYMAREPQEKTESRIVGRLMRQLFDGSPSRLMLRALSAERASREELDEIRAMLNDQKKRGRK
jgi:predicted transcriptional regulator